MSPIYLLRCRQCKRQREFYLVKEDAIKYVKCLCGAMNMEKMPTAPSLKKSGTYSFNNGGKDDD